MALYEVVLRQRYFQQNCITVWNYYNGGGIGVTPSALELVTLMGFIPVGSPAAFPANTIGEMITLLQSDNVNYLSVEARNLYSLTDFYEAAYSPAILAANTGGDSMPPFVAFGLRSTRTRLDIRRGSKRLVGVLEANVQAGGELTSGAKTLVSDLADEMGVILAGATATYSPAVISRLFEPADEDHADRYVLYPTEEEQEEHTMFDIEWQGVDFARSQVSRQYGRGQ